MDAGNYIANQMSNLIEHGETIQEEFNITL